MLAFLFSCCGLRRRPLDPPDERAPLIPQSDDAPSPQPRVIDHQKLKERLGSVVRSKEGKMVNVNAQFPFALQPDSSSRSSRNVSGGTVQSSRAASPSPPRPLQKSPSTASFEDTPHNLPLPANPSAPILNVRIVKSARSTQSTRGRPQRTGDPNGHTQTESQPASAFEDHHPEAPPFPEDFSIHDAGAVARSWGD